MSPQQFFNATVLILVIGLLFHLLLGVLGITSTYSTFSPAKITREVKKAQEGIIDRFWFFDDDRSFLSFTSDGHVSFKGAGGYILFSPNPRTPKESEHGELCFELERRINFSKSDFICEGYYTIHYSQHICVRIQWNKIEKISEPCQPFFTASELESVYSVINYYPQKSPQMWWNERRIHCEKIDTRFPSYGDPIIPVL